MKMQSHPQNQAQTLNRFPSIEDTQGSNCQCNNSKKVQDTSPSTMDAMTFSATQSSCEESYLCKLDNSLPLAQSLGQLSTPSSNSNKQSQRDASRITLKGQQFIVTHLSSENALQHKQGYLDLLNQLTVAQNLDDETFQRLLARISSQGIIVAVLNGSGKLVAASTLLVEQKIAHNGAKVGHVEDVVVDKQYRGFGLGKVLLDACTSHASSIGCYKVILDCTKENVQFYEKCGFKVKEIQMRYDIPSKL